LAPAPPSIDTQSISENQLAADRATVRSLGSKDPSELSVVEQGQLAAASRNLLAATPSVNATLSTPVGDASRELAAASSNPVVIAPQTTNAPTTNNSNVTNISNQNTIGSASARPTEPSFIRVQNSYAGYT